MQHRQDEHNQIMQLICGQLEQVSKQLRGEYIPNVIRNIQRVQENKVEVITQVMGIIHALLK
jgi:hypothetical protein